MSWYLLYNLVIADITQRKLSKFQYREERELFKFTGYICTNWYRLVCINPGRRDLTPKSFCRLSLLQVIV